MRDVLGSVVLAISSFRSDEAVLSLLGAVHAGAGSPFHAIVVVDSLGSGAIAEEIARQGWRVTYINSDRNLGSAGNLALRLQTAAGTGAGWCYAVNHDGIVDLDQVRRLARHGVSRPRVGAVYPTLLYPSRGNSIEAPRRSLAPQSHFKGEADAGGPLSEVSWSSSNCALYSLDAIREGVEVWADLWMGWEDLALGWMLRKRGWTQYQCRDVVVEDSYEYEPARFLGRTLYVPTKPSWYAYYQIRNLLLIRQRSGGEAASVRDILRRSVLSLGGLMFLSRRERLPWLRNFGSGLTAGLKGKAGKGAVP